MKCAALIFSFLFGTIAHAAPWKYRLEQLVPTARLHGLSFSPDASEILASWDSGAGYKMRSVLTRNAKASPVATRLKGSVHAVSFFSEDERILYQQDTADGRKTLRVLEPDGRQRDLAPDARTNQFLGWAADRRAFYVLTSVPSTIRRIEADSYESSILFREPPYSLTQRISPDGQWIASEISSSPSSSDVALLRIPTRENQSLAVRKSYARYHVGAFDPQSRWLYYLTDEGGDFLRLRRYGLETGKHEDVERADSDIVAVSFSPGGKYRATILDQDGRHLLKVYDMVAQNYLPVPDLPKGYISSLEMSRSEKFMAFYLETDRSPKSIFCWEIGTPKPRKLTEVRRSEVKLDHLVASEPVRFNSFDGLAIPCLLYKPHQATTQRKAPALVWLHGGPTAQSRVGYSPHIQYLVNRGFVVLAVNYRGSTGYGRAFMAADDRKHGHEPLLDCIEAKKYLAGLPFVAADRIAVVGESYGGYMVLAALAFHRGTFKAGVDLFGVSNWPRRIEDIASKSPFGLPSPGTLREFGDPVTDHEKLKAISPVFHAERIREPLFILQGTRDPKIPKAETDTVVHAVTTNKVPLEYLVADEEHGLAKLENYLNAWRRIVRFLETYL